MAKPPGTPEERRALFRLIKGPEREPEFMGLAPERIRREMEEPKFMRRERGMRLRYPHRFELGSMFVQYRRTRWHTIEEIEGYKILRHREVFCWLQIDALKVGGMHIEAFDASLALDVDEVWEIADGYSADGAHMWQAIKSSWEEPVSAFLNCGEVVWLRDLWMWPEAPPGAWADAFEALVEREFPYHSVVVAWAFPTEYMYKVAKGTRTELAYARRVAALSKHLCRALNMSTMAGAEGQAGWLWRPAARLADGFEPPEDQGGYRTS